MAWRKGGSHRTDKPENVPTRHFRHQYIPGAPKRASVPREAGVHVDLCDGCAHLRDQGFCRHHGRFAHIVKYTCKAKEVPDEQEVTGSTEAFGGENGA